MPLFAHSFTKVVNPRYDTEDFTTAEARKKCTTLTVIVKKHKSQLLTLQANAK
ncbi:hypothetical protein SAMN05421780_10617 [Flexibacter flexilis DSM 6793]|uniref:Uncharacterized protein n=1 Tax=Flexibacter flexilis DSM 6793 TaxID=927664 RepID=A0A1I1JT55_9BACT|nr:hypothetical protein SAMN05421780_10617 [Flexibacter flexilis DSM 6793]